MNDEELKRNVLHGVFWKLFEKIGMQVVQFLIQIFLARLLMPEDYGIIGLTTIFISISDVFVQQGITTALIQKKNVDQIDFSSVFFANILFSFVLYGILYLSAPAVAWFYKDDQLIAVMRVLSLSVITGALGAVQTAAVAKRLQFKKSFIGGMANIITQGIVGIILAYGRHGVWALVWSKVLGTLVGALVLWSLAEWKPEKKFSLERIREMLSFSSKILGTNLLNTLFNNMHSLIIGRYFTAADLGFYQRGQQMPQLFMTAIDGSINELLFPTLSQTQDERWRLKRILRRSLKTSMFIVTPVLMGLFVAADTIIVALLTKKWLPCVPFMRLSCIICALWPLSASTHALNAMGHSDITFKVSLLSKGMTLFFIFVCIKRGIYAILLGTILSSLISVLFIIHYSKKIIGYGFLELLCDIMPSLALSVFMGIIVMLLGSLNLNIILKLGLQVIVGFLTYISGAAILRMDSFSYILELMKSFCNKA